MSLQMREHQHVEWKECWRDEYQKWICGFANADGGVLVIGRNDKGAVVGVENAVKLLVDIPNKVRDLLGIMVDVNLFEESGKEFVQIAVEAYPNPRRRVSLGTSASASPDPIRLFRSPSTRPFYGGPPRSTEFQTGGTRSSMETPTCSSADPPERRAAAKLIAHV